jgi:Calmodulin-binding
VQDVTSNVKQLSAEERAQLVGHLKTKWSSVNTAYQKMTFTLDTPTKQKRKETYEAQLAEIEKDIQLLEKGEVILMVED